MKTNNSILERIKRAYNTLSPEFQTFTMSMGFIIIIFCLLYIFLRTKWVANPFGLWIFSIAISIALIGYIYLSFKEIIRLRRSFKTVRNFIILAFDFLMCFVLIILPLVSNGTLKVLMIEFSLLFSEINIILNLVFINYNYKYSSRKIAKCISDFYTFFSAKTIDFNKLVDIASNNDKLDCFLRPTVNNYITSKGELIIVRLLNLKHYNIDLYFQLKNEINLKTESHMWNMVAIDTGILGIVVSLVYKGMFTALIDIFNFQKKSYDHSQFIIDCMIIVLLLFLAYHSFKITLADKNIGFYKKIKLYFEEVERR